MSTKFPPLQTTISRSSPHADKLNWFRDDFRPHFNAWAFSPTDRLVLSQDVLIGFIVLFLVDRRALAAQAVKQFASFDAEPGYKFHQVYEVYHQRFHREDFDEDEKFDPKVLPKGYLKNPKPGNAFVYVSTIQRMTINLFGRDVIPELGNEEIEEDAEKEPLPIHAFDLIIADECHRGYTAKETAIWRAALDHFDAIKIGLTATPAAHTMSYFKEVVYRYEYERAVREGFLVDYDVVAVKSNVRMQRVFLKEGEQVTCWSASVPNVKGQQPRKATESAPAGLRRGSNEPDRLHPLQSIRW